MRSIQELVKKHELFIEQSLRDRLYKKGTYADGKVIKTINASGSNVYSEATINLKAAEGQPTDHVTLFSEGELHESFETEAKKTEFQIGFEDDKEDGKVSDNIENLDEAIMVGEVGLNGLRKLILKDLQDDFRQDIRKALLY